MEQQCDESAQVKKRIEIKQGNDRSYYKVGKFGTNKVQFSFILCHNFFTCTKTAVHLRSQVFQQVFLKIKIKGWVSETNAGSRSDWF